MNDSTSVVLGLLTLVLIVILYVWVGLALAALFRKTGEDAWKAWVPVLNTATLLRVGGFSPWLVLINLVPFFGLIAFAVIWVIVLHRVSTAFGAGGGMTVLGVVLFPVWASILGFGSARWEGPSGTAEDLDPARRRQDLDGPYVPLIGGWIPDAAPEGPATPIGSAPGPRHEPSPLSEPVALPFAAPSGSLSDAVPGPVDWAPPARTVEDDPAPPTSVFAALDAMRDSAPADEGVGRRADSSRSATRDENASAAPVPAPADDAPAMSAPADLDAKDVDHDRPELISAAPLVDAPVRRGNPSSGETPAVVAPSAVAPDAAPEEPQPRDDASDAPWADVPRRGEGTPVAPIGSVPLTRPAPPSDPTPTVDDDLHDDFPEPSEAVSAVVGAPDAGAPRSARTSVSALYTQPEVPGEDDFEAMDRTVVARRRRIPWRLVPPNGTAVDITSTVVILGRRPSPDPAYPDAQLVAISDETRTVSKTHARLELRSDTWYVTDLGSTNGVLFATLMGTEVEAPPGEEIEAGERFFLGDAEVRLSRSEA